MKHPQYLSLAEHAYQRLLDEIVRGVRPAGSKMSEEGICAELEISRTPAREALMQLHRDGIVERLPRRGCFVKGFRPGGDCRAVRVSHLGSRRSRLSRPLTEFPTRS